ncbi:hypothetical protein [Caenimonas koreensis]|uniref:hypothetical protein n=1 Tax=Caenimonas koreensis TaxID=367474 RepID=UPI003783435D
MTIEPNPDLPIGPNVANIGASVAHEPRGVLSLDVSPSDPSASECAVGPSTPTQQQALLAQEPDGRSPVVMHVGRPPNQALDSLHRRIARLVTLSEPEPGVLEQKTGWEQDAMDLIAEIDKGDASAKDELLTKLEKGLPSTSRASTEIRRRREAQVLELLSFAGYLLTIEGDEFDAEAALTAIHNVIDQIVSCPNKTQQSTLSIQLLGLLGTSSHPSILKAATGDLFRRVESSRTCVSAFQEQRPAIFKTSGADEFEALATRINTLTDALQSQGAAAADLRGSLAKICEDLEKLIPRDQQQIGSSLRLMLSLVTGTNKALAVELLDSLNGVQAAPGPHDQSSRAPGKYAQGRQQSGQNEVPDSGESKTPPARELHPLGRYGEPMKQLGESTAAELRAAITSHNNDFKTWGLTLTVLVPQLINKIIRLKHNESMQLVSQLEEILKQWEPPADQKWKTVIDNLIAMYFTGGTSNADLVGNQISVLLRAWKQMGDDTYAYVNDLTSTINTLDATPKQVMTDYLIRGIEGLSKAPGSNESKGSAAQIDVDADAIAELQALVFNGLFPQT